MATYARFMRSHVLLVEDDEALGAQVVALIRTAGFDTLWWKTGRRVAREDMPDVSLVLLDLMLPGTYGMEMLRDIRAHSDVPVLVLSARDQSADKTRALSLGADDYVTKPFWPEELLERVKARLRRPSLSRGDVHESGGVRIDTAQMSASVHGQRVELTRVEFEFLRALMLRPDAAVTRAWLAANVLDPDRDGGERTLDVHISRLRKKLAPADAIETVWGIGYRWNSGAHP